jgi:putative aldouronate transport system substrate-binding protein
MKSKRIISLMLALGMMVGSLAACGGNDSNTNGGSTSGNSSSDASATNGDEVSSEIDMNEDPYTVAVQVVTMPGVEMGDEEEIENAINEITVPAINAKIDIQYVWISEVANTTSMAIASNEKIDLVHVATVNPLSAMVGSEMLYDMNEGNLLQNRGKGLVDLFGDLMSAGEVNGQQLAVPANIYNANAQGLYYNKTMADEAGITVPETGNLDDLEKVLYELHEKNPDVMGWFAGQGTNIYLYWLRGYNGFGTSCAYGAVMDSDNPIVENFFATEDFKDYCLRMYKWRQDGILQKDATDTNAAQTYVEAGTLFCTPSSINQSLKAQYAAAYNFDVGWMQMTDYEVSNSSVTEYMWGIASNSERPDKAMDMLNLLYTNEEVANLLKYGIQGEAYDFADGSDKVIVTNGSHDIPFLCVGDTSKMYIQSPNTEDFVSLREAEEAQAKTSDLTDYMFDDTDFQTESALLSSTINEYLPGLQNGMYESEEATLAAIDEFNAKLEAAGINDVIAANQAQLDAHIAAKANK